MFCQLIVRTYNKSRLGYFQFYDFFRERVLCKSPNPLHHEIGTSNVNKEPRNYESTNRLDMGLNDWFVLSRFCFCNGF